MFFEQPGKFDQHAVAVQVPFLVVHPLEMVDVEDGQREFGMIAAHQGELPADGIVQSATVVDPRQRIGPHLREGHQAGALLADFVVGVGNLRGQLERGLENVVHFAVELLPGRILLLIAEAAGAVSKRATLV